MTSSRRFPTRRWFLAAGVNQASRRNESKSNRFSWSRSTPSSNCSRRGFMNSQSKETAVIQTNIGEMVVELWPDVAPRTVENFKTLAEKGFYDGTCFHRVIKGFMIQGGDPLTKDPSKESSWGTGGPGYKIKAEFNDRHHDRGVLSMARSNDPDSAGSQFFICHGTPHFLDKQYTAFGKLIKGDDILEKIATTATHPPDRPNQRMAIETIKIVSGDLAK